MNRVGVGRNDPCPCKSGRKYKKCCLLRGTGGRVRTFAPAAYLSAQTGPRLAARTFSTPKFAPTAAEVPDGGLDLPDAATVDVLPIEIGLKYTYPEPLGIAEVSHVLPAGRIYQLADGRRIVNDDIEPDMQVVLQDGAIGTISAVRRFYDPPDPPIQVGPGQFLARVVGTIKHKGIETVDVSWPGNTVTGSTDHRYYSVSRGGYVPASELHVDEILRSDDGQHAPVTSIGERKLGLIDLYNIEVEHFHNYHVGKGPSVLVHNGAAGGNAYTNLPADVAAASRAETARLKRVFQGVRDPAVVAQNLQGKSPKEIAALLPIYDPDRQNPMMGIFVDTQTGMAYGLRSGSGVDTEGFVHGGIEFRACPKCEVLAPESFDHEVDHGNFNERLATLDGPLVLLR